MNDKRDWTKIQLVRTIRLKEMTETELLWDSVMNPATGMGRRLLNLALIMEELQTQRDEALEIARQLAIQSEIDVYLDHDQFSEAYRALTAECEETK